MRSLLKEFSAWVPVAMSATAIIMLGLFLVFGGPIVREQDEGFAAHVFQILMVGQIPIIAFFALRWLPQRPREAVLVLVLQLFAGIAAAAPVFILHL